MGHAVEVHYSFVINNFVSTEPYPFVSKCFFIQREQIFLRTLDKFLANRLQYDKCRDIQ